MIRLIIWKNASFPQYFSSDAPEAGI